MANTLKIKRGLAASIPQGQLAEPLFTTDTYDLYIGKGSGGNQKFQQAISLTTNGSSGSSTFVNNVLNVPTYTLSGLGGEPAITPGTTAQYWRGDKSWQTLDTSVVPENGPIYFTEPRVLATVLTGLNLTGGGTISASDSVLQAFGKIQNQISAMAGGVSYQGTWNASTNTPTLTSSVGTKGYYYVVSVAGSTNLNGITDWKIGDWAIFNGTTWDKVDNTDAVSSVNGFTGAVNLGLGNISDVTLSSPTNTQLLRFNGTTSRWENWTPTYISGAITSLNGLTASTQTFATGTSGTDFNISSVTSTHTFNIPDASATARGVITTGTQTIAGSKTFSSSPTVPSLYLSNMTAGSGALYYGTGENRLTLANYNANGIIRFETGGGANAGTINANQTWTFPAAISGTSATFSGNVGINVTLSSWDSGFRALQIMGGFAAMGNANAGYLFGNGYNDGIDNKYFSTAPAARIDIGNGIVFRVAPSGTANTAIPYTAALTLASTGAATFSSSVTAAGLTVTGTNHDFYVGSTFANTLNFGFNTNTNLGGWVNYTGFQGGTTQFRDFNIGNGKNGVVAFFQGSTGNVGIGTTSPATVSNYTSLTINGTTGTLLDFRASETLYARLETTSAGLIIAGTNSAPLRFNTEGTERMRILSATDNRYNITMGNDTSVIYSANNRVNLTLGITGTNSALLGFKINGASKGYLFHDNGTFQIVSDASTNIAMFPQNAVLAGVDNAYTMGANGSRWSAVWAANGTIQTSDARQKKDITPTNLGLDFIMQLNPVSYKWIVGGNKVEISEAENENEIVKRTLIPVEGKRTHYGLIAQQVKEVLGDIDFGGYVHDEETDTMALRYDQFIAPMIKAIQEQQAQIQELKQKLS